MDKFVSYLSLLKGFLRLIWSSRFSKWLIHIYLFKREAFARRATIGTLNVHGRDNATAIDVVATASLGSLLSNLLMWRQCHGKDCHKYNLKMQQLDFNVNVCRLLNSKHSSLKFCNSRCDELSLMLKKGPRTSSTIKPAREHWVMKECNKHLVEVKPWETLARQLFF
jgi:hypothetical protein